MSGWLYSCRMSLQVHVVVVCKSELAFLKLRNSTVVEVAIGRAASAACAPTLSVWMDPEVRTHLSANLKSRLDAFNLGSEPTLYEHVDGLTAPIILIHDAQRPLTLPASFDRVSAMVSMSSDITRVCPAHLVVDTLKEVSADFVVSGTVDRSRVQALSSPEGYLKSELRKPTGVVWNFDVASGKTSYVQGDQESIRIREAADVLLVESFLIWQTKSS